MSKGLTWRVSLILLFLVLSFIYLTPTLVGKLPPWWKGVLPKDKSISASTCKGEPISSWRLKPRRLWKVPSTSSQRILRIP